MNPTSPIADKNEGLPRDITRPVGRRAFLRLILGTTVLVLLFNMIAGFYLRSFTANIGYWVIREKWRMLLKLEQPVEWLILGDSGANHGVVPSVFNTALSTTSINLGTIRHTLALSDLWMLEAYIGRFGPPRNVLMVRGYNSWRRNVHPQSFAQMPAEWSNRILWDRKIDCNFDCMVQYLVARFVPLYAENTTLSRLLQNPWTLFRTPLRLKTGGHLAVSKPDPDGVARDLQNHLLWYGGQKFTLSQANHYALEKLQALSERYKFNLYLANSPIYEGLYRDERVQAYYAEVWKILVVVTARSPRVRLIPGPITFPVEQMTTVDHLIDSAAEVFTRDLAAAILSLQANE